MTAVYYAEHRLDESRRLRSRAAAELAPFTTRADWETGVIIDPSGGGGPLWVRALARQSSQRRGAAALVALARTTAADAR